MKKRITRYFDDKRKEIRERIISLLSEMVRQKTVNVHPAKLPEFPYLKQRGEEYRVANIVRREFKAKKIPYEIFEREKGRTNIVGRVGRGTGDKKLLIASHMDVVPPGDGWVTDPFDPVVKGGRIVGRGVLDNKGPLVSSMIAAESLAEAVGEENIKGELLIAGLADEEATHEIDYGIGYLLEEKLIEPTYAIIPDIGMNMEKIDIAEKGRMVVEIKATGKQAHGSTPELGVNAVYMMGRLIPKLEAYRFDFEPHPLLVEPTLNLGEIQGGAAVNIVPGECTVTLDIRTVPGQTSEGVRRSFEELAAGVEGEFEVGVRGSSEPHEISPDNPLVRSIQGNTLKVLGFAAEPFGLGGGTFAKTLNQAGICAVGFGPGDDEAFHMANEWVEIDQLVDFAHLIALISLDLV